MNIVKTPLLAISISWTIVIFSSFLWNLHQVHESIEKIFYVTARSSFEKDLIYRSWNAGHGGVYVKLDAKTKSNPFLNVEHRDITTKEGIKLTLMNPAFMVREVFELAREKLEIISHITSDKPLNPNNKPDEWEKLALEKIKSGYKEFKGISEDGKHFRLLRPLYVQEDCLQCHKHQGYKLGDLRGGISISIPVSLFAGQKNKQILSLFGAHFGIWFIGFVGLYFGYEKYKQYHQTKRDLQLQIKEFQSLQSIMDGMADPIVVIDTVGIIIQSNPAFREFFSLEPPGIGIYCYEVMSRCRNSCFLIEDKTCPLLIEQGRYKKTIQKECVLENGSSRIVEITITPYYDENNVYKGIIEILRDITEKVEAEKKLIYIAHYDKLTSLPNKFLFEKELENSLTEMKKIEGELALFFIDLIRFKNINNILGHPSGDKILIEVGQRLKSTFSKSHFISRFGGNVFTIIVAGNNTKEELNTISQLVLDAFSQPFEVNNNKLFINACIGICSYPQDGENVIELMQHAEIALNRAKNEGRNSIQHYSDLTEKYSFQRLKLENELYHSIENKELEVYYQPQVDSNNENLIGFEALCRWKHPVMGEISPGDFIGIAEEIGFIVPLGKFVLKKACEQTKLWMDRFNYPFRISVNISPRQLLVENIVFDVKNILEETGLEPSSLELEITESSIIQNVEHVLKVLHSLKELGIKISVDDFGTGYSSLQYIKSLPIDSFKIDLSFVRGVPDNLADKAVIKTIVSLAKNLNLHTVAEGVENSEQKEFLTTVGCNILQGYYYGKPTPAKEVEISLQNLVKQVSL